MEQVLVIDAENVKNMLYRSGLLTAGTEGVIRIILEKHYFYVRSIAEYCDSVKQIIPYAVLRRADEIFVLERLDKQTEKRLHGKLSIGVGGHINPDADEAGNPIEFGLYKELHEEVQINSINKAVYLGIINDLSTPVSNYHIGILYEIWTDDDIRVLETEKMRGQWQSLNKAKTLFDDMETWSQIALDYICGLGARERKSAIQPDKY